MKKFAMILVVAMMVVMMFSTVAFAADEPTGTEGGTTATGGKWDVTGLNEGPTSEFNKFGGKIIGAIRGAGVIVAVAVLVYVGIKFMIASPSEKANIKGMLIPYIVGAVLIVAATEIVGFIFKIASTK